MVEQHITLTSRIEAVRSVTLNEARAACREGPSLALRRGW